MSTLAEQHRLLAEEIHALKEENILLKQKIEALEKEKALRNLEDALKERRDKKKGETWPDKMKGWHVCYRCGSVIAYGARCSCFTAPSFPKHPSTPQIWCSGISNYEIK